MGFKSAAIVVSAGTGVRFGGLKQLGSLGGRRVIDISLSVANKAVDFVVCVKVPGIDFGDLEADVVVDGGSTRSESVRAGLEAIPKDVQYVLVHDAARPLASFALYGRVLECLGNGAQAVIPVIAITDTVKEIVGNKVFSTLDRSRLFRAQTPQGFQRSVLELAHSSGLDVSDDSQLVESMGIAVEAIVGSKYNFKITEGQDLVRAENLLKDLDID